MRRSESSFRLATQGVSRVLLDAAEFHLAHQNNSFDALAMEDALLLEKQESGAWAHLLMNLETFGLTSAKRVKGLVLVGPRGSGKREAIDLALESVPDLHHIKRMSYATFMDQSISELLRIRNDSSLPLRDPVPYMTHALAKKEGVQVLVVEDMLVTSLVEAMLLRRMFKGLLGYGLGVVITTTRPPSTWYANGVNAHKLEPFRRLVTEQCDLVRMDQE
ncbi:hypothetical protein BASA81_006151 [Batrachochytrium salamandrivorans]|nr:hypothetical protein BASA81_006151 [Batrachochytrium salamandrivorans]